MVALCQVEHGEADAEPDVDWDWQAECSTPAADDAVLEGNYRLPSYVHDQLFPYQQTGTVVRRGRRQVGSRSLTSAAL